MTTMNPKRERKWIDVEDPNCLVAVHAFVLKEEMDGHKKVQQNKMCKSWSIVGPGKEFLESY